MAITKRDYDAASLMQFACGFDSLSGDVKGTAVSGIPGGPSGGTETIFSLYKVEEIDDFLKNLEVSASASIQAGWGKGGAKAKFASKLKIHEYSVYIAATVTVSKGTRILQSPKLDDAAAQMLTTPEGQVTFRKMYGDEFLAGVTSGGEFIALLEIRTKSRDEQQEASASVSGSDAVGANTGSGSFSSFIQSIKSKYELSVHSLQRGGSDPNAVVTPETLIEKATVFPGTVTGDHVFDYVASFQTYDVLPRPEGASIIDIQNQKDVMEALGVYRGRYQRAIDSIDYVLDNHEQFATFDSMVLVAKRNELLGDINKLMATAAACHQDYTQCALPVDLADPVFQLPVRLGKTDLEAIAAAKTAAVEALGHAVACKGHVTRLLQISQNEQPGLSGTELINKANTELANAKTAAALTHDAANVAITAGVTSIMANEYIKAAQAAATQADEAVQGAMFLHQKIINSRLLISLTNNSQKQAYLWIVFIDNYFSILPGKTANTYSNQFLLPYGATFEIRLKMMPSEEWKSFSIRNNRDHSINYDGANLTIYQT